MSKEENETLRARVAELEKKSEMMRYEWEQLSKLVKALKEEIERKERRDGKKSTPE